MDILDEMSGVSEMQQQRTKLRSKRTIRSVKQENILQDLQEDRRAGDRKANSRDFH
jgi:hypothetical protein